LTGTSWNPLHPDKQPEEVAWASSRNKKLTGYFTTADALIKLKRLTANTATLQRPLLCRCHRRCRSRPSATLLGDPTARFHSDFARV
jgi:hypothetical protein